MNPENTQPHIAIDIPEANPKYPNKKTLKAIQNTDNGIGLEEIEDLGGWIKKIENSRKS